MNHLLVMADRERVGREASPTAAVIDSQSVKTTESGGPRGYDGGKKVMGRKRQVMVDTVSTGDGCGEWLLLAQERAQVVPYQGIELAGRGVARGAAGGAVREGAVALAVAQVIEVSAR